MEKTQTQRKVLQLDTLTILDGVMQLKDMKFNNLNILVGTNGSGKSYVNAHVFFSQFILLTVGKHNLTEQDITKFASQIFNTPLDGLYEYLYDEEHLASFSCQFENGVCVKFNINCDYTLYDFSTPIYMSTVFRTFTAIKMYLMQRNMLLATMTLEQTLDKLTEHIKLYDVLFMEMYIHKCPIKMTEAIISRFESFTQGEQNPFKDALEFNIELSNNFYIEYKDGRRKYMHEFSAGIQSLVNMLLISM